MRTEFEFTDPYEHTIHGYKWETSDPNPKAVVMLIHGAGEYCMRYEHFAQYLNEQGYHVIGNDHLGHGKTSTNLEHVYFDTSIGFHKVYEGVKTLRDIIEKDYPKMPVIMFAHSMGSFIGRYALLYDRGRYDMALFSGTGFFSRGQILLGKILANIVVRLKGETYVSSWFNDSVMGGHIRDMRKKGIINKPIEWLSQDKAIQKAFVEDEYCGMPFTIGAQRDILHFIPEIQDKQRIKQSASGTAIYFLSGDVDGLGKYGVAIKKLYNIYRESGYSNVKYSVLNNTRHEIINEVERDAHYKLICEWMDRNL